MPQRYTLSVDKKGKHLGNIIKAEKNYFGKKSFLCRQLTKLYEKTYTKHSRPGNGIERLYGARVGFHS